MKIYSMTATFGKLEHENLTLEPGLNIIDAPNEWGKSTWCAFLVTMLYGLDTRAKTTKTALADKERFAPWSGAPMSGRIDLQWNGRDITIERSTKGRTPLGVFRAYETATGVEISELTATNCGQTLLGVERSVFTRSAFLRFSDLPVTQDDALRHRLNALVTTGDESGAAEALGAKLKELKNHCRYNRSGALPQAEAQRDALERKIHEYDELIAQSQRLKNRQQELTEWVAQLENHKIALQYAAAQDNAQRLTAAAAAQETAQERRRQWETICADLPRPEEAKQAMAALDALHQDAATLQTREQQLPPMPPIPEPPPCFAGVRPEDAPAQAQNDQAALASLTEPKKPPYTLLLILAAICALAAVAITILDRPLFGAPLLLIVAALCLIAASMMKNFKAKLVAIRQQRDALCRRYGTEDTAQWLTWANRYAADWDRYNRALELLREQRRELDARREELHQKTQALSGRTRSQWQEVLSSWAAFEDASRAAEQAQHHYLTLQAVVKTAPAPTQPDLLTYSEEQTRQFLSDAAYEQQQLQHKLGQYLGQMDTLGSRDAMSRELEAVQRRLHALEQTNAALERALDALTTARQELQRRFAPRIAKRAQELFARLTHNRYDRFVLGEDLTIQAGAQGEDVLHSQQWRSDGTIDQLYLALRLAVAGELIPDAPLILDDALVRFDDTRLATALEILQQEAEEKQVILFTCQSRERELLAD